MRAVQFPPHTKPAWRAWQKRNHRLRREWERNGDSPAHGSGFPDGWTNEGEDDASMGFLGGLGGMMGRVFPGKGAKSWGYRTCDHWRTPIKMRVKGTRKKVTVLASGLIDCPREGGARQIPGPEPFPDLGFYLDSSWFAALGGMASAGVDCPVPAWWPFIIVDWRDRSDVSGEWYKRLVELAVEKIRAGGKVEVACQGGHGRTGTLLAGILAVVEGRKAEDAIKELRERYCDKAIESHSQECQVYKFLGEEEPVKPKPEPTVVRHVKGAVVPWTPPTPMLGKRAAGPKMSYETYKSTWDDDECRCGHRRGDHADDPNPVTTIRLINIGKGECRLCAAGSCKQFVFHRIAPLAGV